MTRRSRPRSTESHDETAVPTPEGGLDGERAEARAEAGTDGAADAHAIASSDGEDAELRDVVLVPHAAAEEHAGASPAEASGPDAESAARAEIEGEADVAAGPGNLLSDDELLRAVTALVFASPEPLSSRRLVDLLERPERARVEAALATVRERLAASGLSLELRGIAGGHQILSTPDMGEVVQRLFKARKAERISAAALETLAVVAYRQPVTKAEIEAIRGVQAGPILRTLIERGLVRVAGRADVPGHPLQYGTTREFLDRFGLESLQALPRDAELAKD